MPASSFSAMSTRPAERRRESITAMGRHGSSTAPPLPGGTLRMDAEDLNPERARARAVELRHQNPLPLAEHHFPAADLQREIVTKQQCAQVRIRVHAIAVGVIRIVVHPLRV